jgi:hypothetical protein
MPEDGPLRVETCSVDFKSANKTHVALMAEYVKSLNILLTHLLSTELAGLTLVI